MKCGLASIRDWSSLMCNNLFECNWSRCRLNPASGSFFLNDPFRICLNWSSCRYEGNWEELYRVGELIMWAMYAYSSLEADLKHQRTCHIEENCNQSNYLAGLTLCVSIVCACVLVHDGESLHNIVNLQQCGRCFQVPFLPSLRSFLLLRVFTCICFRVPVWYMPHILAFLLRIERSKPLQDLP